MVDNLFSWLPIVLYAALLALPFAAAPSMLKVYIIGLASGLICGPVLMMAIIDMHR